MLVEGRVMRLQGEQAIVSVKRVGGCGRCHEVGGCGGGEEASCEEYALRNQAAADVGSLVEIDLPDGGALKAATVAYLLPLACMLFGVAAGKVLEWPDLGLFAACLLGGGLGAWFAALATRRGWIQIVSPRITRVVQG